MLKVSTWGVRVAQWWDHSPRTNVAWVQISASTPYVGWVCCWFSPLQREVFLRVLQFSPLLKNQDFQIQIRSGTHRHVSMSSHELLSAPWVNTLQQLHNYNTFCMPPKGRICWKIKAFLVIISFIPVRAVSDKAFMYGQMINWNNGVGKPYSGF